jgi:RNA polymerase sigma-70 factor (ECF subfamily)
LPIEPATDAELIEDWKNGRETGASELIRRHGEAVARYLGSAGAADDVDDLVQEAFFRAFKKIDSFRGQSQFRTWVIRIASNALMDLRRKEKRAKVISIEDRVVVDGAGTPDQVMEGKEAESRVAVGISKLPSLQKNVFLMRAQEGLGYDEIAGALGTTPGAARVHYHHAVKRLKKLL